MPDVNYSDVTLNGATPYLTAAADFATLDARDKTALVNGTRCRVLDENVTYQYNGTSWVDPDGLVWESVAASTGWSSNVSIAKINNGKFAILRGHFTSSVDENTGTLFSFPTGYDPLDDEFRTSVAALIGGSTYTKAAGVAEWSDGGSTLAVVQSGLADGENLTIGVNNKGTGAPPPVFQMAETKADLGGANAGSSGILFTLSAPNANNDVVISWDVKRTQASTTDCLRAISGNLSLGKIYNSNDRVYMGSVIYALA